MTRQPKQVVSLCPECSECPVVEIFADGDVQIGEAPNVVTLRPAEWNQLVGAIRRGDLTEVS